MRSHRVAFNLIFLVDNSWMLHVKWGGGDRVGCNCKSTHRAMNRTGGWQTAAMVYEGQWIFRAMSVSHGTPNRPFWKWGRGSPCTACIFNMSWSVIADNSIDNERKKCPCQMGASHFGFGFAFQRRVTGCGRMLGYYKEAIFFYIFLYLEIWASFPIFLSLFSYCTNFSDL